MSLASIDVRHWNLPLVATAALGLACGPTTDPMVGETDTDPSTSSATTYGDDYYDSDYCADGTAGCCYDDGCYYEPECGFDFCLASGQFCVDESTCLYSEVLPECGTEVSVVLLDLPLDQVHLVTSLAFVEVDGDPGSELVVGRLGRAELYLDTVPVPVELPWVDPDVVLDTVAGDFDGDGDGDLAMSTAQSGLLLMTNDGSGTFTAALDPAVALPTMTLEVLDWNGDGVLDLAGVDQDGQAGLLLGDGTGAFEPFVLVPQLDELRSLVAGRFDDDVLDDLVVSDGGGTATVYLGNAGGDLMGDSSLISDIGRERLLLSGAIGGSAGVDILGYPPPEAPSGLFELWTNITDEARYFSLDGDGGVGPAALGDIDGDGSDDLVMSNVSSIRYLLGGSEGERATFACIGSFTFVGASAVDSMAVGDLDGNGRADVAYASAGVVTVLLTQ
jgi:hypothetical protein